MSKKQRPMTIKPQQPGAEREGLERDLQKWQRKYFSAGISHEMWPKAVEHAFEAGWRAALSGERKQAGRKLQSMDGTDWKYDYTRDRAWIDGREFAPVAGTAASAPVTKGGTPMGGIDDLNMDAGGKCSCCGQTFANVPAWIKHREEMERLSVPGPVNASAPAQSHRTLAEKAQDSMSDFERGFPYDAPAAPAEEPASRSVQRRVALQRGEPMPESFEHKFVNAASAAPEKLSSRPPQGGQRSDLADSGNLSAENYERTHTRVWVNAWNAALEAAAREIETKAALSCDKPNISCHKLDADVVRANKLPAPSPTDAVAMDAAHPAEVTKAPEKLSVGLRERLELLRNRLAENPLATDSVEVARAHFVERIDSILRNYPATDQETALREKLETFIGDLRADADNHNRANTPVNEGFATGLRHTTDRLTQLLAEERSKP